MKAKILILIFLSSILLGCRSRKKTTLFTKEGRTEITRIQKDSLLEKNLETKTAKKSDYKIDRKTEDIKTEIFIKGRTDSLNPFTYHNVVNGDTLQSILISGNSDYKINNHYSKYSDNTKETKTEENLNIIQEVARKSVSQETIKKVAAKVKTTKNAVTAKGFQTPVYIIVGVCILIIICLWFFLKNFPFKKLLERLKNLK